MKQSKRFLLLALCAVLPALSVITACGDEAVQPVPEKNGGDTVEIEGGADTVDPNDAYRSIRSKLNEGVNYGGYTFNIVSYANTDWDLYLTPESEVGETLNDAAFRRTLEVEDLLGVDIVKIPDADYIQKFRQAVEAGDHSYDLICFWCPGDYSVFITDQIAYDWQELPYVDLTAPWYNQTANEAYSVAGKQFFAVSDLTYPAHQHFRMLMNKELLSELQFDTSPYDDVLSGKWTFDRMLEYTKGVYADLDGNGKKNSKDRFGLGVNCAFMSVFPYAADEYPVHATEDGFTFNLLSERIVNIVEDVVGLNDNPDIFNASTSNSHYDIFKRGDMLFEAHASDPLTLRDLEFDFGYLPYPKYDEAQKDYVVLACGGLMSVPANIENPERTGMIIEALSAASDKYVEDAFIDQYIENKILRDEKSQQIYRMMRAHETYDLTYNVDPSGELVTYTYYNYFMKKKSVEVASHYEEVISKIETKFAEMYDMVANQE